MQISCAFPPQLAIVDHARRAEELGYARAWVYDSPALYGDVWMALARMAEHTQRIGLGPAVLVPSFRHVLAQASAIATLEELAPGRTTVAIGTGFTGRMALGQKPLRWSLVETYVRQLRALLRGETVEIDGKAVRMIHPQGFAPPRPMHIPLLLAANGPKGLTAARELADGVMCVGNGQPGFSWCALLSLGTVLDDEETVDSPRVLQAAGPALTVMYHGIYETGGSAVDGFPGGAEWRAQLEEIPAVERHLALHEEHLARVSERDRLLLNGDMLKAMTWTGSADEVRARVTQAASEGATEIVYAPMGSDIARELRAFAQACGL